MTCFCNTPQIDAPAGQSSWFSVCGGVLAVVDELVGSYSLQRFDIEGKHGQVRIVINQSSGSETAALIARLRKRLPQCEFSYVNLESTL